jgi:hypothetical protein
MATKTQNDRRTDEREKPTNGDLAKALWQSDTYTEALERLEEAEDES